MIPHDVPGRIHPKFCEGVTGVSPEPTESVREGGARVAGRAQGEREKQGIADLPMLHR